MTRSTAELYVGVDVGGTNITTALVDREGVFLERAKRRTPKEGDGEVALRAIAETVEQLLDSAGVQADACEAIGLGVPGLVDPESGVVIFTPNMNLSHTPAAGPLGERFGLPVMLDNDVNLGTLGEKWLGAAAGADSAVGIFWGTGIGGGIVRNGHLVRGARNAAGEIGHIVMEMDGALCGCGNRGCLEALAGRAALEGQLRAAVESGTETILTELLDGDLTSIRSKALKKSLKAEDPLVTEVMRRASEVVAHACLTVKHLMDPEVIVLGGGVMEACGKFVMPVVQAVMEADSLSAAREGGRVVESTLGDDAVVLGAVALALDTLGHDLSVAPATDGAGYPLVRRPEFGRIVVGREMYTRDVYVRANRKVKKRKKSLAKETYGSSHVLGAAELEYVCKAKPERLIIGSGQGGALSLSDDGEALLAERGIAFEIMPTPEAADRYNEAGGRKAGFFHLTC